MNPKKSGYSYIYEYGRLIGYSSKWGYIEKHYSNPENFASKQKIDYRIPKFKDTGKQYIFRTIKEAKQALEKGDTK